jgi:hypothetical protein
LQLQQDLKKFNQKTLLLDARYATPLDASACVHNAMRIRISRQLLFDGAGLYVHTPA